MPCLFPFFRECYPEEKSLPVRVLLGERALCKEGMPEGRARERGREQAGPQGSLPVASKKGA